MMSKENKAMNRFYIITGGPGAGKITLLETLKVEGYEVIHEAMTISTFRAT